MGRDINDVELEGGEPKIVRFVRPTMIPPGQPFGNVPAREPVKWLWKPYVPLEMQSLLVGPPQMGKGVIVADTAARVTTGNYAPPGGHAMPRFPGGNVLIAEAEDSFTKTLAPRLEACGADMSKVCLRSITEFNLSLLRDTILQHNLVLVILSPIMSFLDLKDSNNNEKDVRQQLDRIHAALAGTNCAVLGLIHPNKSTSQSTMQRLMGSSAYSQMARSIIAVAEKSEERRLVHIKNNVGRLGPNLRYEIVDEGNDEDDSLIRPKWTIVEKKDWWHPDSLWNGTEQGKEKRNATAWVIAFLEAAGGTAKAADVFEAGIAEGLTRDAIHKAQQRCKRIESEKEGFEGGWIWTLKGAR